MYVNPRLAKLLETYEPQRLKAILAWFHAECRTIPAQYERLNTILNELYTMDAPTCYESITHLELDDMVQFALLNEFGADFSQTRHFHWLNQTMRRRLAQRFEFVN